MMPSASRAVGSNKVRLREPRVGARLASPAAAARRRGLVRRRNRSPLDQVPPASSHGDGLRLYHQADRMMEAMSISRSDIAPATKGSEQGTGNDSRRRVWRIAIRRLRLVAVRIRLVAVRNIACACVRVQGYGGGMVGAASARTGSGSCWRSRRLVTFTAPATFRFLGGITCDHEPIAEVGMGHAGALSQVARAATRAGGSVTRWRGMSRGSPGKGGARR